MLRIFVLTIVSLSISACGGSGSGGGGGSARSFTGVWHLVVVAGVSPSMTARWGLATADDTGAVTFSFTSNTGGVQQPAAMTTGTYTVGGSGSLDVTTSPGSRTFSGGISSDGQYANLSATSGTPAAYFMIRVGPIPDTSVVAGNYHVARMRESLSSPSIGSWWSQTIVVDVGAGTIGGGAAFTNLNGAVSSTAWGSGPFTIDGSNGVATGPDTSGGAQVDGQALLLGGRMTGSVDPIGAVYVKHSSAATAATFSGTYRVAGLQGDFTTPEFLATAGTLNADGANGGSMTATQNREGGSNALNGAIATSVQANGVATLTLPNGDALQGAISADGRLVALGGGTLATQFPAFFVLVRLE